VKTKSQILLFMCLCLINKANENSIPMKAMFLLIAMLAGITCHAQKAIDKAYFYGLIKDHKYGQLLADAHKERNKVYGKIWLVDYYIAKASCGLGKPDNAVEWFNSSLKYPNVNDEIRKFLLKEMSNCRSGQVIDSRTVANIGMPDTRLLTQAYMLTATSRGKMGPVYNCKIPPQELTTMREVSIDELESRLFDLDKGADAIKKYKTLLNSNYHINISGRFLLITYGNNVLNNEQIAKTSERLERTYNFFSSHYNLRPPDKLLAVYLLPDKNILRKTALLVHGIKIPDANIGYSNLSDLSLVGVSDITHIGTLCHELFHLMIRTDVGDVPPWMDEGIACIYETSRWNGNELTGDVENWRTDVLRTAKYDMSEKIPHLRDFLKFTWQQFDGLESNDLCKAAINYAYGKHLMLYFQEQGKLTDLVTAVKNRTEITTGTDAIFQSDSALLEKVLNNNLETIERKFNDWMGEKYRIKPNPSAAVTDNGGQHIETREVNNLQKPQKEAAANDVPQVMQQEKVAEAVPDSNNQLMVQQMPVEAVHQNVANVSQQSPLVYNANDVINSLSVHVKTDATDKSGDAIAYSYYIVGESSVLDNILEVNYQRNHDSFHEFKSNSFIKSTGKDNNFSFKGYQWGYIKTVNVYIVLKDNSKSAVVLKTIVYDN
jgi:hypothetical protein